MRYDLKLHPLARAVGRLTLPDIAAVLPWRLALVGLGTLLLSALLVTAGAGADMNGNSAPGVSLESFLIFAAYLTVLVAAGGLGASPAAPEGGRASIAYRAAAIIIVCLLALAVVSSAYLAASILGEGRLSPTTYFSDAVAFDHYNAERVLRNQNPYTCDQCFWDAVRRFPNSDATPVRRGRYANSVWGPSFEQVRRDLALEARDPAARGPEFAPESLHSYPALAFLLNVPVVWAGMPSTALMSIAGWLIFAAAIWRRLPAQHRLICLTIIAANVFGTVLALRGAFEFSVLLAFAAWYVIDRRWLSPLLLGLTCATKQLVWPLVPLYLVLSVRRYGWRETGQRAVVMFAAFAIPNLPFALAAPAAWGQSMLLPVSLPAFPDGVGLIVLARAGILPLWPPAVYGLLEAAALAALIAWVALRRHAPRPELVLLVGLLPLALAWRSLPGYFAWLPELALYAAIPLLGGDKSAPRVAPTTQ